MDDALRQARMTVVFQEALEPMAETGGEAGAPTVSSPAMTRQGVILGTAAYMSPEQAKGRPADRLSEMWAFGVVLYEMLTGRRPFAGHLRFINLRWPPLVERKRSR